MLRGIKKDSDFIKEALEKMKEDAFTLDELESLSQFIPTEEEKRDLLAFDGDYALLGNADKYFIEIMDIPNLQMRISSLIYKLSFSVSVAELKNKCEAFSAAIDITRNDKRFFAILETVLALGNYMNGSTRRGGTYGFKLSSLKSLQEVKSVKNSSLTLLHYIVDNLQSNSKDIIDIIYELDDIHAISKENIDDLITSVSKLSTGMKPIQDALNNPECEKYYARVLGKWLPEASETLGELVGFANKVQEDFKDLLNFYAEPPATKSDQFFSIISQFGKSCEACIVENIRIKEEEEKEKKRLELENKRASQQVRASKGGAPTGMAIPSQGQLDQILAQMKSGNGFRKRQTDIN